MWEILKFRISMIIKRFIISGKLNFVIVNRSIMPKIKIFY